MGKDIVNRVNVFRVSVSDCTTGSGKLEEDAGRALIGFKANNGGETPLILLPYVFRPLHTSPFRQRAVTFILFA